MFCLLLICFGLFFESFASRDFSKVSYINCESKFDPYADNAGTIVGLAGIKESIINNINLCLI